MVSKSDLYIRYETRRKSFITRYTKYSNQIKQELLQYSLDLNESHIEFVYECLFRFHYDLINSFIKDFRKLK